MEECESGRPAAIDEGGHAALRPQVPWISAVDVVKVDIPGVTTVV
jgi:hypothetical protein